MELVDLRQQSSCVNPSVSYCKHCGLSYSGKGFFCCAGCEGVYSFLQEQGLQHFYDLQKEFRLSSNAVNFSKQEFLEFASLPSGKMELYLEGIHCLGCLWVLEKLPEILPGVLSAKLDFSSSILSVSLDERTNFQVLAKTLQRLGYRPRRIERNAADLQVQENRSTLIRLGIAAACTGNIMILAVSVYAGASGLLALRFSLLSAILSLPVFFYSAIPLYKSAWASLRIKKLSVDQPIVAAILAGILYSIISLFQGRPDTYFDSLSMLVFLLLSSRYILRRLQQKHLSNAKLLDFVEAKTFLRLGKEAIEEVSFSELKVGDILKIQNAEILPTDGIVHKDQAMLDLSLLTGESRPEIVPQGELVYAGSKNLGDSFLYECTAMGRDTRLGQILHQLGNANNTRTGFTNFADRISKWFVALVFLGACALLLYFHENPAEGIRRALALIIVTCPCVLAFAVPLSLVLSTKEAAKRGIFLKNPETLEKIPQLETIFLDKTGTLTEGKFHVLGWIENAEYSDIRCAVLSLESKSRHPIARTLVRELGNIIPKPVTDFEEILGYGVKGKIDGIVWSIHRAAKAKGLGNNLEVERNSIKVAHIILGDCIRREAKNLLSFLRAKELILLSGDRVESTERIANELQIPLSYGELSPEKKAQYVAEKKNSLMLGDGANDALALRAASVGVAMHGGVELCLKNADIFLSKPGLASLIELFKLAKANQRITRRNLGFSVLYNLLAAGLAITGKMNPFYAAVLMPMSALTVFSATRLALRSKE